MIHHETRKTYWGDGPFAVEREEFHPGKPIGENYSRYALRLGHQPDDAVRGRGDLIALRDLLDQVLADTAEPGTVPRGTVGMTVGELRERLCSMDRTKEIFVAIPGKFLAYRVVAADDAAGDVFLGLEIP